MAPTPAAAAALLIELTSRGIELQVHGGRLRYRPRSALTAGLVERVKAHKPELLALLRGDCAPRAAQNRQRRSVLSAAPEVGRVQPDAPEPLGAYDARHELSLAERVESGYVNPGWEPAVWAARLRQLADRCADMHPELAQQYRTWADNVVKNHKDRQSAP